MYILMKTNQLNDMGRLFLIDFKIYIDFHFNFLCLVSA